MKAITLKMEGKLLNEIDNTIKKHRYSTRTEFIRDSIKHQLTEQEKKEAIRKLEQFKGSLKGKAKKTEKEVEEIMEKNLQKGLEKS